MKKDLQVLDACTPKAISVYQLKGKLALPIQQGTDVMERGRDLWIDSRFLVYWMSDLGLVPS